MNYLIGRYGVGRRQAFGSDIAGFTCSCGEKVGTWARTASIVCIAKKTWVCDASGPGGMCRQYIDNRSDRQADRMKCGEGTLLPISSLMVGGFGL